MGVRIRMKRLGRKNRAFYRIDAMDSHAPRGGKSLETLGTYDPLQETWEKKVALKRERVEHWLSVGAQPTETVRSILNQQGIAIPWKKKRKSVERTPEEEAKREDKRKKGAEARQKAAQKPATVAAKPKKVKLTKKDKRAAKRAK